MPSNFTLHYMLALDRQWYEERLDDRSLLDRAVAVDGLLAVPVGGRRRGGFLPVEGKKDARAVLAVLHDRPGFPRLRVVFSDDPEVCDNVIWGDDPPAVPDLDATDEEWAWCDEEMGRFYGYSDTAIRHFITKSYGKEYART